MSPTELAKLPVRYGFALARSVGARLVGQACALDNIVKQNRDREIGLIRDTITTVERRPSKADEVTQAEMRVVETYTCIEAPQTQSDFAAIDPAAKPAEGVGTAMHRLDILARNLDNA